MTERRKPHFWAVFTAAIMSSVRSVLPNRSSTVCDPLSSPIYSVWTLRSRIDRSCSDVFIRMELPLA